MSLGSNGNTAIGLQDVWREGREGRGGIWEWGGSGDGSGGVGNVRG